MLYLDFPGHGCFPYLFSKFSFASSMSYLHSFSGTMGGHSCLSSSCNLSLYWALVYFKLLSANFATTFLLNVFPNNFTMCVLGVRGRSGFLCFYLYTNKQTHIVGPFGNNLRTGCSLTRNSYGVPQNQVSVGKRGILLYL